MLQDQSKTAEITIELERRALDRWGHGDPSGCLDISAEDVTYFDPFNEKRIDGLPALTSYYEQLRGTIHIDRFELLNPLVVVSGDTALLTYNYVSYSGSDSHRWNCSEIYQQRKGQWKIIHTHWSLTKER